MGPPDPQQRRVVLDAALRHRTIGDHGHAVAAAGFPDLGLVEIGMVFDLIAHQRFRTGGRSLVNQRDGKIRNADMSGHAEPFHMRERPQCFRQRHVRVGPVQQQQVDFGKPQPGQALLGGAFEIVRREMVGPDFCRDENVVAPEPRGAQALADLAFVFIDLRGVDMAIAELDRLLDHARAGPPAQLPGAEPDRRDFSAVGLETLHQAGTRTDRAPLCRAGAALPTKSGRDQALFA